MYVPAKRLCVVEIPKTGTTTIRTAVERTYGRRVIPGHLRLSEMLRWLEAHDEFDGPYEAVALIRDPIERFVSCLNFDFGDTKEPLEQAMRRAFERRGKAWKSQSFWIDWWNVPPHLRDTPLRLFPFERLDAVLDMVGYTGPSLHENSSQKRWTLADLATWRDEIEQFVAVDWALREEALDGVDTLG